MTINVLCFEMGSVGGEAANRPHLLQRECNNLSFWTKWRIYCFLPDNTGIK